MATVSLTLVGFEKLKDILDTTKFPARFRKHVQRATMRNALIGASAVTRAIYKGVPPPNAALTVALKGSSRQLVDTGALGGSVSGKAAAWNEMEIRVHRKARARPRRFRGQRVTTKQAADIAALLYYGASVPVTDKMRRYFYALSHQNPNVKPLKASTKVIVIPPRKFLDVALDADNVKTYTANWTDAVRLAMLGVD